MEKINVIFKTIVIVTALGLCSCTKYNYVDTGLADGKHDCSMWEYFKADPNHWDSTAIMIEHAGLKDVFEGNSEYGQITFLGITNLSIMLYMYSHNDELDMMKEYGEEVDESEYWRRVNDMPVSLCRRILMNLVIPSRLMMSDIPFGNFVTESVEVAENKQIDGKEFDTIGEGRLFLYTFKEAYQDVADAGETRIYMVPLNSTEDSKNGIASCNIETLNGVVHSLETDFILTDVL